MRRFGAGGGFQILVDDRPAVITFAQPFAQASDAIGVAFADLDRRTLDTVATTLLDGPDVGPQVTGLLSDDLTPWPVTCRCCWGCRCCWSSARSWCCSGPCRTW